MEDKLITHIPAYTTHLKKILALIEGKKNKILLCHFDCSMIPISGK